jgi:hypothetical protein
MFAWFMDEVVLRLMMLTPRRRALIEHMDGVRAQDLRLHGEVHPLHRRGWLKP